MNARELGKLLEKREGQLLEFKREWYDLTARRGRAEMARDVIAMANGLHEDQVGHIIIGCDEETPGGRRIIGVQDPPSVDRITEILGQHTRPAPEVEFFSAVPYGPKFLSVIEVRRSQYHPHYSTRDVDRILSVDRVLCRVGAITRGLTLPELEMMIRAKDARIGSPRPGPSLAAGFAEVPRRQGEPGAIRIENRSDEPVTDIWALLDIETAFPKGFCFRSRVTSNLTLPVGESLEFPIQPYSAVFYHPDGKPLYPVGSATWMWRSWLDLTLRLSYRERDGFIAQIVERISLE